MALCEITLCVVGNVSFLKFSERPKMYFRKVQLRIINQILELSSEICRCKALNFWAKFVDKGKIARGPCRMFKKINILLHQFSVFCKGQFTEILCCCTAFLIFVVHLGTEILHQFTKFSPTFAGMFLSLGWKINGVRKTDPNFIFLTLYNTYKNFNLNLF